MIKGNYYKGKKQIKKNNNPLFIYYTKTNFDIIIYNF